MFQPYSKLLSRFFGWGSAEFHRGTRAARAWSLPPM
nr:MAG TPA_asm: hypothetical protein [Caudoviricetes sp.]